MKKKGKTILFLAICVIVITTVAFLNYRLKQIPLNPVGTIGNTAGNLNNLGLFCEDDGIVYFSNAYDNGTLYSMNIDESEITKLSSAKVAYINAGGKYLYYYMRDSSTSAGLGFLRRVVGIYRCTKTGKSTTTLSRDASLIMLLVDNSLYYQHYDSTNGVTLNKLSIDGKTDELISPDTINPASCENRMIYYNDNTTSHFLYRLDTATDTSGLMIKYNMWNPIRQDDYIYFMDMNEDYRLCRYCISSDNIEVLTTDRVDTFNVTPDYVYYQKSSETSPALKRVRLDGSEDEIVAEGIYCYLNATSQYLYFYPFGNEDKTYRTPVNGPVEVSEFTNAMNAAIAATN